MSGACQEGWSRWDLMKSIVLIGWKIIRHHVWKWQFHSQLLHPDMFFVLMEARWNVFPKPLDFSHVKDDASNVTKEEAKRGKTIGVDGVKLKQESGIRHCSSRWPPELEASCLAAQRHNMMTTVSGSDLQSSCQNQTEVKLHHLVHREEAL